MTTFNGVLQSSTRDWQRERFYQEQETARQERELVERIAGALAGLLGGREFSSLVELHKAAVDVVLEQRDMTDEIELATARACVLLWIGKHDRDARLRRCVERVDGVLRFVA